MPYIHELTGWPNLTWNDSQLSTLLVCVRHEQGQLLRTVRTETRLLAQWAIEVLFRASKQQIPSDSYQYLEVLS